MSNTLSDIILRGATQVLDTLRMPAGSVSNQEVAAGADIAASKLVHRHVLGYHQADGSAVAAADVPLHVVRGTTGSIIALEAAIATAAAGDAEVTIDLQRSTGGGAFATVLTEPITLTSETAVRTAVAATIDSDTLVDGDVLLLAIAVDAGTGDLPEGLVVTATLDETPN